MPEPIRQANGHNPDVCMQRFQHIETQLEGVVTKVEDMNVKLFENNGLSYSTRVALLENWMAQELKRKVWFWGIAAMIAGNIILGLWNRVEILHNGTTLTSVAHEVKTNETAAQQDRDTQGAKQ